MVKTDKQNDLHIDNIKSTYTELDKNIAILRTEFKAHARYTKLAVDKAETLMNTRLKSMNEFRESLSDQNKSFLTISAADAKFDALNMRLLEITKLLSKQEGMATQRSVSWAMLVGGIGLLISLISVFANMFSLKL